MPKFRKKPVVIEAVQWQGDNIQEVLSIVDFDKLPDLNDGYIKPGISQVLGTLEIPTLEGVMTATSGDWIIRGVEGEVYPCKPSIFETTYEPVE